MSRPVYGKYYKRDPAEASRRYMNNRLLQLQQKVLRRFHGGPERQMMRATMRQLIDAEPTLQAKIGRLLKLVDELDIIRERRWDREETQDCSTLSDLPLSPKRDHIYNLISVNDQGQYNLTQNERSPGMLHKYMSQSNLKSSFSYPDDRGPDFNRSNELSQCFNDKRRSQNASKSSLLSFNEKEDLINEGDLFSFRTQGVNSPQQQSRIHKISNFSAYSNEEPSELEESMSMSAAYKKKRRRSTSKISSVAASKSKSRKKSSMKINYDGKAFSYANCLYSPSQSSSKSGFHKRSKSKKKLSTQTRQKLCNSTFDFMLGIKNRIKLSCCVTDLIQHSRHQDDHLYCQNRYKHELEARDKLSKDIQAYVYKTGKWKY